MIDERNKIYVERLAKEWDQHGKIILSIDFDSTISFYETVHNEEDIKRAINLIKDCQQVGCYNIIHTACNPDRYNNIIEYCNKVGIRIDSINKTPENIPYGKPGSKVYYNHGLCDRHALPACLDILEEAMVRQRSNKLKHSMNYEGSLG